MKATPIIKRHFRKTGFWRKNETEQVEILKQALNELNNAYGTNIGLEYFNNQYFYRLTGGGYFSPSDRKIYLYKISLMTFLHEFAHAIGYGQTDAVLWSHKVFKEALPVLYRRARNRKLLLHLPDENEIDNFNENGCRN